jgi:hypothetical protein
MVTGDAYAEPLHLLIERQFYASGQNWVTQLSGQGIDDHVGPGSRQTDAVGRNFNSELLISRND